ncbi:MAG: recombination protein RecR [Candidatus Andersenbacteria bacterium CG10_big_fil_rev_8_21_14_0_10_54_11]|uniref:Recombination protein RecR n=1 Tax=Candidatus Andersenbacteria bacterium CG10_big_fil_rev_8_21_14_0_10_54_11 TaxID=1974485 RepID=A0A2M6WYL5_9BACT|nr:MAG: recombination protein RecR [Candidatus Andersenbacteria bacterium CG10_big_fil_rev_8_21_14_0_10_54_11]
MRSILPAAVRNLSQELMRLPGIGPKSARRLSIYLLRQPRSTVASLGDSLKNLHARVRTCRTCFTLAEEEECIVCRDESRERHLLCVVESPLDVEALERTESYRGMYHVLGGVLSPLEGVGPEQLSLQSLFERVGGGEVSELIIALNPTLEGEATARHIVRHLPPGGATITRLARGLPTGGDIEFADAVTLSAALEGRKKF